MRLIFLSAVLSLAFLCSHTVADVSLGPFPNVVHVGETYTLNWTATDNYSYTLWLIVDNVIDNAYDWSKVSSLGDSLQFSNLNPSIAWTVPSNLSSQDAYALWLDIFPIPFDGASFWEQTGWFGVTKIGSPTATASSGPINSASNGIPINVHHKSLSGGAIAGIVIGCIIVLALLIGAILLGVRRRRRSGFKSREAAARAKRLAPVMQENFSGYELHSRTPQVTNETDI